MDVGDQKFISRISEGFAALNTEVIGEGRSACCDCDCGPKPTPLAVAYSIVSCSVSSAMLVVDEAVDCVVSLCTPKRLLNSHPLKGINEGERWMELAMQNYKNIQHRLQLILLQSNLRMQLYLSPKINKLQLHGVSIFPQSNFMRQILMK